MSEHDSAMVDTGDKWAVLSLFCEYFMELAELALIDKLVPNHDVTCSMELTGDVTRVELYINGSHILNRMFILEYHKRFEVLGKVPIRCDRSYSIDIAIGGKEGLECYYYPCGCAKSRVTWKQGMRSGLAVAYRYMPEDNNHTRLHVIGRYWNNKRHGIWHWYGDGEDIELSIEYHNDKVLVVKHDKRKGEAHPALN